MGTVTSSSELIVPRNPWSWVLVAAIASVTMSCVCTSLVVSYFGELEDRLERIEQLLVSQVKKADGPTASASGHSNTAVINAGYEQLIREDMEFWRKVKLNEHMRGIGSSTEPGRSGIGGPAVRGDDGSIGCQCGDFGGLCGEQCASGRQLAALRGQCRCDLEKPADLVHPIDDVQPRLQLNLVP